MSTQEQSNDSLTVRRYNDGLRPARANVHEHQAMKRILAPAPAQQIHRFLLEYCALGVQITEPVDSWIRRAGQRTTQMGLSEVGEALVKHAAHEAGHHLMFVDDVHQLAAMYNARYAPGVDPAALLDQAPTPKMLEYIALHEDNIQGDSPFAQIAIELEVEGLSVSLGPRLIQHLGDELGAEVVGALSFLTEHVAVDVGHTALNNKLLGRLLLQRPDAVDTLIATGTAALQIYLDFFGECWERAQAALAQTSVQEGSLAGA